MKKHLSLLACLVLAATAALAQTQTDAPVSQTKQAELHTWQTYTVDGERFSVSLPTVPAMTTQKILIEPMKTRRERMLGAYADGAVYSIHVYENVRRQSLKDFIAEQNGSNSWNVSTESTVTVEGVNGKQYSSSNKTGPGTAQFFSAAGRLYKFTVRGTSAEDAASKQFFSSIVLGKNAEGIEVHDGPGLPLSNMQCDEALTGKQVDTKPRLVMKPEPAYTESARQNEVVGTVILKVVFGCHGTVVNIRSVQGLPNGLTERAIAAARKIKYIPAMKDGKPVSMWIQLEYNFNLY